MLSARLAMLIVHPDKVSASDPATHRYIAERCFEALNREFGKFSVNELR